MAGSRTARNPPLPTPQLALVLVAGQHVVQSQVPVPAFRGARWALGITCPAAFPACERRQYSKAYVPLEDAARAAGRGIWSGSFELPEKWRKEHPRGGSSSGAAVTPVVVPAAGATQGAAAAARGDPLPANGCAIKGNINSKGEKVRWGTACLCRERAWRLLAVPLLALWPVFQSIPFLAHFWTQVYHVPGGAFYERTVIELDKGERYFCTAAEAEAAGWRASAK